MNSLQIEHILKSHYATGPNFRGCFAADQLNSIMLNAKFPISLVVNTDISTKPGEHWVAVFIYSANSVEYFDSLAEAPNEHIENFLSKFLRVIKNEKILQNPFTDVCGHFCIYFIVKRSLGISFSSIVNFLYRIKNADIFVKNFVITLIS